MPQFVPVDGDPFAASPKLAPVDHDPFNMPAIGAGRSAGIGATDVGTFGFGDEIIGATYAAEQKLRGDPRSIAELYQAGKDAAVRVRNRAQQENPKAFMGGQLAGGLVTAVIPGGAIARGANLATKAVRGGTAGALYGGAYGAGSGEGVQGRLEEATKGATIGFGTGAVAAPIAAGIGNAAGKAYRSLTNRTLAKEAGTTNRAFKRVAEAAGDDLNTGALRRPTKGDRLFNLGPQLQASAEGIATQPGRGQNTLLGAVKEQQSTEGTRIKGVIDQTLGRDAGRVADKAQVELERKAAGRLYNVARNSSQPVFIGTIRSALDNAIAEADGSVRASLERLRSLRLFADPKGGTNLYRSALDLHAARMEIDDAIRAAGEGTNTARLLNKVRKQIDFELKRSAPGYRQADAAYKAALDARSALEDGRQVFTRAYGSPDELRAELAAMAPPVRARFLKGARDAVSAIMGSARNDANAVRRELFEKGWNKEKLAVLLGPDRALAISRALEASANRHQGQQALTGNSRTAMRISAQKAFPNPDAKSESLGQMSLWGTVLRGGEQLLNYLNRSRRGDIAAEAAQLLASEGPERDRLMDLFLQAAQQKGKALTIKEMLEIMTNAGAISGAAVAQ
jgi:hypothetical protein